MQLFLSIVLAVMIGVNPRDQLPPELQQVIHSRKAHTSQVEWTVAYLDGPDAGLEERQITRTVDDQTWQVNLGDENGGHNTVYSGVPQVRSPEGWKAMAIPREELAGPYHTMLTDGELWYLEHQKHVPPITAFAASASEADRPPPFDFETAGIGPFWSRHGGALGVPASLLEGFESATYSVSSQGDLKTVVAQFSEYTIEWQLDRRYGEHPVQSTIYKGGAPIGSSYTELSQVDGRWVPASIEYHRGNAVEAYVVLTVKEASFDKPWHQQEFSLDDIGVQLGTQVLRPDGTYRWDGLQLVSLEKYDELLYLYGMRPGPVIIQHMAEAFGTTADEYVKNLDRTMERWRARYQEKYGETPWQVAATEPTDQWDVYVDEFLKKHKLDEPQIKRAYDLLERGKKLRDSELHEKRKALKAVNEDKKIKVEKDFDARVQKIFDRVLVRGLKRIPPVETAKLVLKNKGSSQSDTPSFHSTFDLTEDGAIDLHDWAVLQNCFSGASVVRQECRPVDADQNGQVNLYDFAGLTRGWSGP